MLPNLCYLHIPAHTQVIVIFRFLQIFFLWLFYARQQNAFPLLEANMASTKIIRHGLLQLLFFPKLHANLFRFFLFGLQMLSRQGKYHPHNLNAWVELAWNTLPLIALYFFSAPNLYLEDYAIEGKKLT